MWWVMFELHRGTWVFLSPNQQFFMNTVINCTIIVEDHLQAGCSIWKSVAQCSTCIMVFIGVNIQRLFVNTGCNSFKLSSLTLFSYALQAHATGRQCFYVQFWVPQVPKAYDMHMEICTLD